MSKVKLVWMAVSLSQTIAVYAADSTFLCKQIDADNTLIFSGTTVISKDGAGNYGKPVDVTFGHTPNGGAPVWTTQDGSTRFILMMNQIYVMAPGGNVQGKIVCE